MSKYLIIKYKDSNREIFYEPITGEFAWREHWLPVIVKHELDFIWLANGRLDLMISDADLLKVQQEFDVLRHAFESDSNLSVDARREDIDRIEAVQSAISMIMKERDAILRASIS